MKCHSTNINRSSNYNNISSNIDKDYCNHNHFISSMFYYLHNHNHNNDYHNHCNHNHYPNHKPLHGISRLLTSPTGTMIRLILCLCFMLTLNYIINILNPHYSYADTKYSITYDDNVVTDMPVDSSNKTHDSTIPLANSTPLRIGYRFLGWCNSIPTTTDGTDLCPTTTFQPNSTLPINQTGTNNNFRFYAMWKLNTMQNVSEWGNTIGIGEETAAIDTRDGKTYSVARLCMSAATHTLPALNTCDRTMLWMTQNLDLELGPSGVQTLSNADSDLNSVSSWTPDATTMQQPAIITNYASGNPSNSVVGWTNSNSRPYWGEGGDYYVYTSNDTNTDTIYNSLTSCVNGGHTEEDCRHYHVGNYYNWSAAVASNDTSSTKTDLTVMPDSICPKGWRLPNGLTGSNGAEIITEFNQLGLANDITAGITTAHNTGSGTWVNTGWTTDGFNKFRSTSTNAKGYEAPLYFVRSGHLDSTTLYSYGVTGHLWSSTSQYTTIAYNLTFISGEFLPALQLVRYFGFPVRCVAR